MYPLNFNYKKDGAPLQAGFFSNFLKSFVEDILFVEFESFRYLIVILEITLDASDACIEMKCCINIDNFVIWLWEMFIVNRSLCFFSL